VTILLDTSALLAMLNGEPGGDRVTTIIADACMSVINLAEVASYFVHLGMPPRDVDAMLLSLPITLVPADAALALAAGHLRGVTARAGLSLGDRFCLALAAREGLPAWTADRQWAQVADAVGVEIMLIR
jgi:PIN domain nuclease of toxin-antitoxin system